MAVLAVAGLALAAALSPPASAADATVTVDWSTSIATAGDMAYGLNVYQGFDPATAGTPGNATYKANVASMAPGIVRYHSYEMMKDSSTRYGWLKNPTTSAVSWDADKIAAALGGSYAYGPQRMINIPSWPSSMADSSNGGALRTDMYDDFAAFCADLVRIVNVQQHRGVKYWEITNEWDNPGGPYLWDNAHVLGTIVSQAAAAMKQVDPTIKVGGPAFVQPSWSTPVEDFFSTAANNLDFVSYHAYSGSTSNTPSELFDGAQKLGWYTSLVKASFAKYSSHTVEWFHDEWNINGSGGSDPHRTDITGAIFDALGMASIVKNGGNSVAWNEADNWFGKLDNDSNWTRRPGSYVFQLYNADMKGSVASASTDAAASVQPYAVVTADGGHHLALVNRSDTARTVKLDLQHWSPSGSSVSYQQVTSSGLASGSFSTSALTSDAGITLPALSVTVVLG